MDYEDKIENICLKHGVRMIHLISRRRGKKLIEAKKEAYKMLRDEGPSFPQIGKILHKHHSTILKVLRNKK